MISRADVSELQTTLEVLKSLAKEYGYPSVVTHVAQLEFQLLNQNSVEVERLCSIMRGLAAGMEKALKQGSLKSA